jgi:hypothetical protein
MFHLAIIVFMPVFIFCTWARIPRMGILDQRLLFNKEFRFIVYVIYTQIYKTCVFYIYAHIHIGIYVQQGRESMCVIIYLAYFLQGSGRVWSVPGVLGVFCHP